MKRRGQALVKVFDQTGECMYGGGFSPRLIRTHPHLSASGLGASATPTHISPECLIRRGQTTRPKQRDATTAQQSALGKFFLMQFPLVGRQAGRPTIMRAAPARPPAASSPNGPEVAAKTRSHPLPPFCLSETEEVIYVLFGYGSLVWRIGSGERVFFCFFLEPHTESICSSRLAIRYHTLR